MIFSHVFHQSEVILSPLYHFSSGEHCFAVELALLKRVYYFHCSVLPDFDIDILYTV